MNLITEYGRRDRSAITARAKELHAVMEWGAAVRKAHDEAAAELRARFNRHSTVPAIAIGNAGEAAHV